MSLLDLASLVLAPTATKEGKVYSAIPDTGDGDMTFTRGSSATRINSAGLIEKETQNLLSGSNDLDNTSYWIHTNLTSVTGGQSGYDGSSDAFKIVENTSSGQHNIQQTIPTNKVQTISVYAKAAERNFLHINQAGIRIAYYNLSTGALGNVDSNVIDATITDIGSGWYRCTYTALIAYTNCRIGAAISNGSASYTGDGTSGVLLQDTQVELGLVAQSYIETTTSAVYEGITDDVPRVDYSGGGCPSLLLEPSRTNVVTQSEYIDSFNNFTIGDGSISSTSNYAISPEGVKNATRIVASATGSNYAIKSFTPSSSTTGNYVCSMYIKSNTSLNQSISFYARGAGFNPITVTPEWQRFVVTGTGSTNFLNVGITQASGQENIDILVYGAQMEQDVSYVSSYIPTYGTSTTRVQDSCSKTGISELIGQTEGTLYWDFETTNTDLYKRLSLNDGTTTNWIFVGIEISTGVCRGYVKDSGTIQADMIGSTDLTGDRIKLALAYSNNDFALYANGSQVATDSSGTIPSCSRIDVGSQNPASAVNSQSTTNQVILFPTRLTNDQLEELTK
jgi:hypothetical protein